MRLARTAALAAAVLATVTLGCGDDDGAGAGAGGVPDEADDPSAATSGVAETAETGATSGDRRPAATTADGEQRFPDVTGATAEADGSTWTISATVSSPYDSPERYADAWRVVAPDGTVLAVRELLHDHAGEQPFTRSERGVEIPDDVDVVTIEARDLEHGWGGATFDLELGR